MSNLATFSSAAYSPDSLLLGGEVLSRPITLLSGQNLLRGALLGQVSLGAVTKAVKASGANTGAGTLTIDATAPLQANDLLGVYTVRITAVGEFVVVDPKGVSLGLGEFAPGATVTFSDRIKFALADDASTHFAVGDGFDITVAAGSGKYVLSTSAAVDGSQIPDAVLAEDTNASGGDVATVAYVNGTFNQNALTFGTGQTVANCAETLRTKDIMLVDVKTTY